MKIITYQDIVNMNPCSAHKPSKYISKDWTGTALDVLDLPNVAPTEKIWVVSRVLDDKILRLFAVACARRALARIAKPDIRSLMAVNIAEACAYGRASKEELAAAYAAATAAYAAATAAYAAATAATAATAAYAAANAATAATAAYAAANADAAAYAAYAAANADAAAYAAYAAYANAADAAATAAYAATANAAYAAAYAARESERSTQIGELIKIIKENMCLDSTY